MQSKNLCFEPLTADHAAALFSVLNTPAVQAFIDPTNAQTMAELQTEYSVRAKGPVTSNQSERWFNMAVLLKSPTKPVIGRLEATSYGNWGEIAYLFGEAWWGRGLAFEAVSWWHDYLSAAESKTEWWATVAPDNDRSIRLLKRLSYIEKTNAVDIPKLQSYDEGDLCFVWADC